jgi:gliding motility-associated-like protein
MKRFLRTLFAGILISGSISSFAQAPVYPNPLTGICNPAVPHFVVNLNGTPDSVWVSPNVDRQPTCCGDPGTGNWTFVSFTVTLDPNVAEVAVGLAPSDPGGNSSGYWIDNCGTWGDRIEGGTEVCITGPGPHNFWYGKSGGNANSAYTIVQIPKPTFPNDDSVRIGCSLPLDIYGLNNITMTSGNSTYDSWLNMSDPSHPIFTPGSNAPSFIDFTISGNQIASATCGNYVTTDVVRIYIYQPLNITVSPNPANFCQGGNVTLTANVTNPVGTLYYSWINNQTGIEISTNSSTLPISIAGNYTVYISDDLNRYGCAPVGITRYVSETLAPIVSAGADDTICSSNPNAFLTATVTNPGTGILWSTSTGGTFDNAASLFPVYTASALDLTNGFVDLTVTAFGCQDDNDVVRIYFNNGPTYNVITPAILCHDSTGTVSVNVTAGGGAPWAPINYYWSVNGTAGPSSIELGAGTYSVTVVNSYGCGSNTVFTLTEPNALSLVMTNTDANPTGSATATISGGTSGYTYSWENSLGANMGITSTISGLPTDYYTATVTDANGCFIIGSTVVNDPSCAGFDATALGTDVSCYEDKDGSATVISVVGGSGNYDYVWLTNPTQNNITASGLSAGVYEVVVTDLTLGCRDIAVAVVNSPTAITNIMTHTDNTAIGGTIGTASANPAGGTPGYLYSWSTAPVQTAQTATGLAAGMYSVIITDANGCTITDNVIINEPPCNNFQAAVTTNEISCNGLTDGSAQVIVAHGTSPYTYSIDGGAFLPNPSGTFLNLADGVHTLSIMDAQNCVVLQNFFITEPAALSIGLSPNNIICNNQTNGTIDLSITGGTFPYSFDWINNNGNVHFATSEDVIGLGVGTYSVIVTDANGCTVNSSTGISQPNEITATVTVTDITCYGDDNGAIDATISGGQIPYSYSWVYPSGTANTQDLSGLSPGQYFLTVTDANSCTSSNVVNVYVNEPQQVTIHSSIVSCPVPGATTTLVEIDSISGGTDGPYQLTFDGGAPLASGVYTTSLTIGATHTVIATDGNGCTVTTPTSIVINPAVSISNVSFNACIPVAAATIPVTVTPSGGDGGPYQVSTDNGSTFNTEGTYIINVPVGNSYSIVIEDTSNCRSLPYSILIPNEISNSYVVDSVSCLNGNDGSILLSASGGTSPYNVSWTGPLSGNPAGNEISVSGGTYTISSLSAGTYSVTITDANSCTKNISVIVGTTVDLINPTISCPGNITTNNDLNNCFANVIYGTPVGTDNCFGSITTQTAGLPSGSNFPVGTTINTFLVTDAQGRTASCSFTITIIDAQLPTVTCPSNISAGTDAGQCTASVLSPAPVTSDNCAVTKLTWTTTGATTLSSPLTGINTIGTQTFNKGITTVNYVVTDAAGNSSSCSYTVTVNDTENPTITCPANISVSNDNGFCTATINYAILFNDNCTGSALSQTSGLSSGSAFPVGVTINQFTVTDASGNNSTCSFSITVIDTTSPVITCISDITVNNTPGTCETAVSFSPATAQSGCGVDCVTTLPTNAGTYLGSFNGHHYVLSSNNADWNTANTNSNSLGGQLVSINDAAENAFLTSVLISGNIWTSGFQSPSNPGFSEPAGGWAWLDGNPFSYLNWNIGEPNEGGIGNEENLMFLSGSGLWNDYNGIFPSPYITEFSCPVMVVQTAGLPSGSNFSVGTTAISFTAYNANGGSSSCGFNVIVNDIENPVITTCPADITTIADAGDCFLDSANVNLGTPVVTDNCSVFSVTNNAPATFPVGTTTVTWTITDVNGNSSTCQQDVTVTDDEIPVITTCPATVNVNADNGSCIATNVILGTPVASDNCGIATILSDAPSTFPVGSTTVTWTVTDVNGNLVTCTQTVTVTDNQLPVIICDADVTQNNDPAACGSATVILNNPYTSDNCGIASLTNDAPAFFPVGTTTVTWTITDVNGNSAQCTQDVTIIDNELPVIVTCVTDQTVVADAACEFTLADYTLSITATDNCGYSISQSPVAGTVITTGTTNVIITVIDNAGNTITCNFDVTVEDTLSPVILSCPSDIAVNTDSGVCGAIVNWVAPTASDNCGVNLASTHNSGDLFSVGTTTVVYTAIDPAGNSTVCSFDVTVTDNEVPTVISCSSNIGSCDSLVSFIAPTATDNCGIASIVQTTGLASGSIFPVGTTNIVYTITDNNGNISTCSFDVIIHPTPYITFAATDITCNGFDNGIIDITVNSGTSPFTYLWSENSTTEDLDSLKPGNYSVIVTDTFGCSTSINTIIDEPETLVLNETHINADCYNHSTGSINLTSNGGTLPYQYNWSNLEITEDIDTLFAGTYTVIVTDANGCNDSVSVEIEQPDSLELTSTMSPATCSGSDGIIDITVDGGTEPYIYNWTGGITNEDLIGYPTASYSVTVTDANGCLLNYTDSIHSVSYISIIDKLTDVDCFGNETGIIDILVINGTPPYSYTWSNGDTTEDLTNIGAGTYFVSVTDSNQCGINGIYTINEPVLLETSITSPVDANGFNVSYYGGDNGEIEMVVTGGTNPYNIIWVETGDTTLNLSSLTAGTYNVVVTDANGCVTTDNIILTEPFELAMPTGYSPNGDGANDYFVVKGIEAFPDNQIQVYNRWGNIVYQESGYHNMWNGTNSNGDELPDGTYFVVLVLNGTDIEPLTGYVDLRRSR